MQLTSVSIFAPFNLIGVRYVPGGHAEEGYWSMVANIIERPPATRNKLRADLARCIAAADALGLIAIAIYLQRALDELDTARI
jgi:hypothetical protein